MVRHWGILFLLHLVGMASFCQEPDLIIPIGHGSSVNSVCFSHDGRYALSGSSDNTLILWDVQSGKAIRTFIGHLQGVSSVCFSQDGKIGLSGSKDNTLILWDIQSGEEIRKYTGHSDGVTSVCLSSDERIALSGSADKTAKIWDIQSGREIMTFSRHSDTVTSVCLSPDGRYALSGSVDATFKLWDIISGNEIRTFVGHSEGVTSVCFSPDGKYALSGSSDHKLKLWDVQSGVEIRTFTGHVKSVTSVCFSPDGKYALSGSRDYSLILWNIQSGDIIKVLHQNYLATVVSVCFSPNGKHALSGSDDNTLKLWDIFNGREIRAFTGHLDFVTSVSFSPEGKYILSGEWGQTVKLWNVQRGTEIRTFFGHSSHVWSVCFSPDGKYALSGSSDHKLILWDVQSGNEIRTYNGHSDWVTSVGFSPDGKYALSGSCDTTLKLWDIQSGKELRTFSGHSSFVTSVCFSPDGKYALSGSCDKTLKLWDIHSGVEIMTFTGHSGKVVSVCFSPDGIYALSGASDSTMKFWNIHSGKEIWTFTGHSGRVVSVCFSPDGKSALSGSNDHTLKLWDIQNEKEIRTFTGHSSWVWSVCLSPDGKYALSGSADKTIKLWDVKSGREIATLISIEAKDYIIKTPDQYYTASRNALEYVRFKQNDKVYDFEQFDVRFNRPDIVLERIGYAPKDLIALYRKAYYTRIKNLGFDTNSFHPGYNAPIIEILDKGEYTYSTSNPVFNLSFRASDSQDTLDRINIWMNEVPVFGIRGRSLKDFHTRSINMEIPVTLSDGENSIKVSCHNVATVESKKERRNITYNPVSVSPSKTYFIGIGVNRYMDPHIDTLRFAVKDIRDQAGLLRSRCQNIDTLILFDSMVTVENLRALKKKLLKTNINDKVIMSFSGHGFIGRDTLFYFGTYDTDSRHPEQRGFAYDDIEWLLDSIPARKKLLLLDACNSGEVDRSKMSDDTTFAYTPLIDKTRGSKRSLQPINDPASKGLENSFELMQELFANLSNGSGAVVISAARAYQSAQEPEFLGNGVFTYKFIEGLRGAADKDHNGSITVNEIKEYVIRQVETYTGGEQNPTVRRDNLEVDWPLW